MLQKLSSLDLNRRSLDVLGFLKSSAWGSHGTCLARRSRVDWIPDVESIKRGLPRRLEGRETDLGLEAPDPCKLELLVAQLPLEPGERVERGPYKLDGAVELVPYELIEAIDIGPEKLEGALSSPLLSSDWPWTRGFLWSRGRVTTSVVGEPWAPPSLPTDRLCAMS